MDNVKLQIDLDIPSSRIRSYLELHNESIEKQVEEGLSKAVKEISEEGTLTDIVKHRAIQQIKELADSFYIKYNFRETIMNLINKRVEEQLELNTQKIADSIINELGLKSK